MLKRTLFLLLISGIYFVLLCIILAFVHSSAAPIIGIFFVSYVAWKRGTLAGLLLTAFNFGWNAVAFRILAPDFIVKFPPDALISLGVHIGVSILLGYFGKLAADLRKEKAALKKLQNELEERVETRTRELEKANEQLNQARKMEAIGHLAGSIAHDFNNYLSIIQGYSSLLAQKIDAKSKEYEYAQTIEKTTQTAADLTTQLLIFARKKKYNLMSLSLNDLINDLLPLLSSAVKHRTAVSFIADPEISLIRGGGDQIKNALLNLCLNARDAMPDGGSLTITTQAVNVTVDYCLTNGITCTPGRYAAVAVTDTGTGIEPEVFRHLFEPFFTTKEEGKGTGMGLAAVYGIAQSHLGAVFAETKIGKGTTFTMLFPVAEDAAPPLPC